MTTPRVLLPNNIERHITGWDAKRRERDDKQTSESSSDEQCKVEKDQQVNRGKKSLSSVHSNDKGTNSDNRERLSKMNDVDHTEDTTDCTTTQEYELLLSDLVLPNASHMAEATRHSSDSGSIIKLKGRRSNRIVDSESNDESGREDKSRSRARRKLYSKKKRNYNVSHVDSKSDSDNHLSSTPSGNHSDFQSSNETDFIKKSTTSVSNSSIDNSTDDTQFSIPVLKRSKRLSKQEQVSSSDASSASYSTIKSRKKTKPGLKRWVRESQKQLRDKKPFLKTSSDEESIASKSSKSSITKGALVAKRRLVSSSSEDESSVLGGKSRIQNDDSDSVEFAAWLDEINVKNKSHSRNSDDEGQEKLSDATKDNKTPEPADSNGLYLNAEQLKCKRRVLASSSEDERTVEPAPVTRVIKTELTELHELEHLFDKYPASSSSSEDEQHAENPSDTINSSVETKYIDLNELQIKEAQTKDKQHVSTSSSEDEGTAKPFDSTNHVMKTDSTDANGLRFNEAQLIAKQRCLASSSDDERTEILANVIKFSSAVTCTAVNGLELNTEQLKAKRRCLASSSEDESFEEVKSINGLQLSGEQLKAKQRCLASSSEDDDVELKSHEKSVNKTTDENKKRALDGVNPTEEENLSKRSRLDSDLDTGNSDLESDKEVTRKVKSKIDLTVFNDTKLLRAPSVRVLELSNELIEKYNVTIPDLKKTRGKMLADSDTDASIARLTNLKNLLRRKRHRHNSSGASTISRSTSNGTSKYKSRQSKKEKPLEPNLMDFFNKETDSSDADASFPEEFNTPLPMPVDDDVHPSPLGLPSNHWLNNIDTTTDEDDEPAIPEKKTRKRKNIKPKDDELEKETESESSTESDELNGVTKKKSNDWRKNRLLHGRLSLSDSSDEERRERRVKKRLEKARAKEQEFDITNISDVDDAATSETRKKSSIPSDTADIVSIIISSGTDDDFVKEKVSNKKKKKNFSIFNNSDSDGNKTKRGRPLKANVTPVKDSSDSEVEFIDSQMSTPGKGRKNIRRVMTEGSLGELTRKAAKEEEERRERIAARQRLYNDQHQIVPGTSTTLVTEELVLDFDEKTKRPLLKVAPNIVKKLKPHQVKGVKFMWDACFESLERMKKHPGSGCILAHCMGLGKTFQVVTLVHTLLSNPATKIKTVLVVCPLSTVLNWVSEFKMWLKDTQEKRIRVVEMSKAMSATARKVVLEQWQKEGGVMVMGYDNYRNLSRAQAGQGKNNHRISDKIASAYARTLVNPGPDVVVCDEGHLLKNEDTKTSKAFSKIRTRRRILLTGTPLQNNLKEYHCMVNFVKPNLLGNAKEFVNRFVNPICNGQFENSTPHDVKVMKRRSHVLHKMLDGAIQRFDYTVLTPFLPPKFEYVISIRLSDVQTKIYQHYLELLSGKSLIGDGGRMNRLFPDWNYFQRIGTHPKCLLWQTTLNMNKLLQKGDADSDDSRNFDSDGEDRTNKENAPKRPRVDGPEVPTAGMPSRLHALEWWKTYCTDDDLENMASSGKLQILFSVLTMAKTIGDKVLVFSQSLGVLRLIEYFLARIDRDTRRAKESADHVADPLLCGHTGTWTKGRDYFRLDGSVKVNARSQDVEKFNDPANDSARLFLISTKAGGLGINLFAANRVIIFDASWNPSHDVQSLFRVYRFGQKKPCYIYRLVAYGTMEEKVYERQVTKLSLACRVVDEQQIERHYSTSDLLALYTFEPRPAGDRPTPILPKDRLLADLMNAHRDWFETYHEHDSLLENVAEEELNEEERKAAWEDYETEKKGRVRTEKELQLQGYMKNPALVREVLKNENPHASDDQLDTYLTELMVKAHQHYTVDMPSTSAMPNLMAVPAGRLGTLDPVRAMAENCVRQMKLQRLQQERYAPVARPSLPTVTGLYANTAPRTNANMAPWSYANMPPRPYANPPPRPYANPSARTYANPSAHTYAKMAARTYPSTSAGTVLSNAEKLAAWVATRKRDLQGPPLRAPMPSTSTQEPRIKVRSMANLMESRPNSVPMPPRPNLASTQTRPLPALQPRPNLYPMQIRQNPTATQTRPSVPPPIQPRPNLNLIHQYRLAQEQMKQNLPLQPNIATTSSKEVNSHAFVTNPMFAGNKSAVPSASPMKIVDVHDSDSDS